MAISSNYFSIRVLQRDDKHVNGKKQAAENIGPNGHDRRVQL